MRQRENEADRAAKDELARHRRAIEALDRQILRLVSRRLALAKTIGEIKRERRIPLRDFEVEAQVEARLESLAAAMGNAPSLGRKLALLLIEKSLEVQAPLLEAAYAGDRMEILVVGGMGGMGRWVSRFLNGQGHAVRVYDPGRGPCPYPRVRRLGPAARNAQLVVVAVPMSECGGVLETLAGESPSCVIAEMCSLKGHLLPLLERLRARGVRLVSFHPMFGPGVTMLSGKKILFCSEGRPEDVALVRGLFETTSAELVTVGTEEHDRLMALVLGLAHLSNIAIARALQRSGTPYSRLEEAAGVTFQKQVATTAEVVRENPRLYYEIQRLNESTDAVAALLVEAVEEIREALSRADREAFEGLMLEARSYFDPP